VLEALDCCWALAPWRSVCGLTAGCCSRWVQQQRMMFG
jgi:hypothetical protein